MKTRLFFVVMCIVAAIVTSCDVERSEKYQALLAERDSLYTEAVAAKGGFDNALNTINEIENEEMRNGENENAIYDLSGRKINGDRISNSKIQNSKLQKGIYIQDGRKVVKK